LDRDKIVGTWDFKWAQGTKLTVAFRSPLTLSEAVANKAREQVMCAFDRWDLKSTSLGLEIKPGWLDPAWSYGTPADRNYDILVSLDSLPLVEPSRGSEAEREILLPEGELGSYNRRVDYGRAGLYVGFSPALGLKGSNGKPLSSAEQYFSDDVSVAIAVHEIGHALGLLHPHQIEGLMQLAGLKFPEPEVVRTLLVKRYGAETAESLHQPLVHPWPGNTAFSDYPVGAIDKVAPPKDNPVYALLNANSAKQMILGSAMSIPLVELLFDSGSKERYVSQPTKMDLAVLRALYPSRRSSRAPTP
jgi:hypothetical protein